MTTQQIIVVEYPSLKITIVSKHQESDLPAYLLGASVIEETQKLGFVKPQLKIQAKIQASISKEN